MKTCSIMQPCYVPWAGYFALIAASDHFFILDDVQLEKQSWQTRNRILISGKEHWLSVPVFHKTVDQLILETEIDDRTKWRDKHIKTIRLNYIRSPHINDLEYIFDIISNKNIRLLNDLNRKIIVETSRYSGIKATINISSDFKEKSVERSQRLIDLCQIYKCKSYLSPTGAKEYLMDDKFHENGSVGLKIFSFSPMPYAQHPKPESFVSHLSFLDVVANISMPRFKDYVCNSSSISIENFDV